MSANELREHRELADPVGGGQRTLATWLASSLAHAALLAALVTVGLSDARSLPSERAMEVGIALHQETAGEPHFQTEDDVAPTLRDGPDDGPLETPPDPFDSRTPLAPPTPEIDLNAIATAGRQATTTAASDPLPRLLSTGRVRTKFFDVVAEGKSFVWVIDRSASMSHRNALELAKREAFAGLKQLTDNATFQTIFYHTERESLPLSGGGLVPATEANIDAARRFLAGITPSGGTEHVNPLLEAIRLKPEVIYFLTDADMMSARDTRVLTEANRRGGRSATIHAIEFGNGPSLVDDKPLRKLAEENDGTYLYIDVQRLPAEREGAQ